MNAAHPNRKQKIEHELREMLVLFLYLAFFFCAISAFKMFLLDQYQVKYWDFAFALINAAVITKVIMIGEYAKLGRMHEDKSLLVSTVWKAFVFGLLVFAFHVVEDVIKRLIHGADVAKATGEIRFDQLVARSIVVFCTFIPLFGFREIRRVIGEDEFRALIFRSRGTGKRDVSAGSEKPSP